MKSLQDIWLSVNNKITQKYINIHTQIYLHSYIHTHKYTISLKFCTSNNNINISYPWGGEVVGERISTVYLTDTCEVLNRMYKSCVYIQK